MPTIAFDMGGVLLTDGSQTAWQAIERQFGVPAEVSERVWREELQRPADLGQIDEREVWDRICSLDPALSREAVRHVFLDQYVPIPQGVEALIAAHEAGWQVLLATNNVTAWIEYWVDAYEWMSLPGGVICSADIGVRKPDLEFYAAVSAVVVASPAYFVDDKPENLDPAEALGFEPVLATPTGTWRLPLFR